jgi:D-erythrulose 1-phosphate 3-epimerase
MPVNLQLGVNNGFVIKNWPEPDIWAKVIAHELGLKYVQLSFDLLDPVLPEPGRSKLCEEITIAANQNGLVIQSTFTGFIIYSQNLLAHPNKNMREFAFQWFESAVEVTSKLGVEACGGHIGAMSAFDYADPKRRAMIRSYLIQSVRSLVIKAASLGQKYFLWEPMPTPREIPHTPEEAIELMEEVNQGLPIPVQLCFDLGHCNAFDFQKPGDPLVWLEKLLPWTRVIHLQQTDGRADHHWPFTFEYNRVGIIDPKEVLEVAKSSPFPELSLFFEFGHAFDAPDPKILDDHKQSIEVWAKYL